MCKVNDINGWSIQIEQMKTGDERVVRDKFSDGKKFLAGEKISGAAT